MHLRLRALALLVPAMLPLLHSPPTVAQELRGVVDDVARGHDVSVAVSSGGNDLYEREADAMRTPASVQKLLLSMALFDTFGPGHRISTRVLGSRIRNGVVRDLWVVGRGDPTIVSAWGDASHTGIGRLAARVEAAGIQRVTGGVVADASYFRNDWRAPGWQPWSRSFAARPTALALDGNAASNPPHAFAARLTAALEERGVSVRKAPRTGTAAGEATTVARARSAPLSDLVRAMNTTSSNFPAEMLGKLLGARILGAPGTMAKGARAIEEFATRCGVTVTAHDSSGLSYANRVSASGVATLLEQGRRETWGRALRASLPSPGRGTLAARLPGLRVRAKTGTLWSGDSALAGWVRLRGGGLAEFAVLSHDTSKSLEDAIVRRVATISGPMSKPSASSGCERAGRPGSLDAIYGSSYRKSAGQTRTPE